MEHNKNESGLSPSFFYSVVNKIYVNWFSIMLYWISTFVVQTFYTSLYLLLLLSAFGIFAMALNILYSFYLAVPATIQIGSDVENTIHNDACPQDLKL